MTVKINYERNVLDNGDFVSRAVLSFENEPKLNVEDIDFWVGDQKIKKKHIEVLENKILIEFEISPILATLHFDINKFVNEFELPKLRVNFNNEYYDKQPLEINYTKDSYINSFKQQYYQGGTTTLSYYLYSSNKKDNKRPLVIFLHGSGERGFGEERPLLGNDVPKTIYEYIQNNEDAVLLVPQATWANELNGWFRNDVRYCLMELIDYILEKENIDLQRVYLVGLSNGGAATWHFAQHYPELFAAIIPCCGYIYNDDKFFLSAPNRGRYMQPTAEELNSLKDMPIWGFHAADDKTVSVNGTIETITKLQELGNKNTRMTIYSPGEVLPDAHASWKLAFNNKDLLPWLFAQKKS